MYKTMVYDGRQYSGFEIDERGTIKNLRTGHIYKNTIHKSGYLVVTLPMGKRGLVKCIRVHKAVAETFIPNPNNYPIVHHKDSNRQNPSVDNLEWVTDAQNTHYYHQEKRKDGELYNFRKFTMGDVLDIKSMSRHGMTTRAIAERFCVSKTAIRNLLNGVSYKEYSTIGG